MTSCLSGSKHETVPFRRSRPAVMKIRLFKPPLKLLNIINRHPDPDSGQSSNLQIFKFSNLQMPKAAI
jgi:hypothetical protein